MSWQNNVEFLIVQISCPCMWKLRLEYFSFKDFAGFLKDKKDYFQTRLQSDIDYEKGYCL